MDFCDTKEVSLTSAVEHKNLNLLCLWLQVIPTFQPRRAQYSELCRQKKFGYEYLDPKLAEGSGKGMILGTSKGKQNSEGATVVLNAQYLAK